MAKDDNDAENKGIIIFKKRNTMPVAILSV